VPLKALAFITPTADHVETQYGTKYVSMTLNQSRLTNDMLRIFSPWLINAKRVPTMKATLRARVTTMRERAIEKKL
jgi:hypothetical protein